MPATSILIKPASSACNINCSYYFYKKLSAKRDEEFLGMMTYETLKKLVINALNYADDYCSFVFQGGEPILAGLDFYRELIKLQKEYNKKQVVIENTIQTNGTLVDDEWAKFFAENKFLVGLSLDGTRNVNKYRVDSNGKETFNTLMNTVSLFNKYKVQYNIVSVVTSYSVKKTKYIYNFFKEKGFQFQQYIPCLDDSDTKPEWSLDADTYGSFLCELFDIWYDDYVHGGNIDIRMFSNWVQMAAGYMPESCGMSGKCNCYFVVEGNGNIYPCDFYCTDEWKLGTIDDDFNNLIKSDKAKSFVSCSLPVNDKCKKCKYLYLCRGGCRRWREPFINGEPSLNCLCGAYEKFFEHCIDRIYLLANIIKNK